MTMEITLRESDLSLEQVRRLVRAADVRGDEAAASELKAWAERTRKGTVITACRHTKGLGSILASPAR